MLIGIDASRANLAEKTGVEWYGHDIIRELSKLDKKNNYRLYSWDALKGPLAELGDNFTSIVVPNQRFWPFTALAKELRHDPVDALFVPSHIVPRNHPAKTVVTIHDIGFRQFKENYGRYHYASLEYGTRWSARRASDIVVPSLAVAHDVAAAYDNTEEKIRVIPNGYDTAMFKDVTADSVVQTMKHFGVSDPYILYLGRLEARKNVPRLIEAFYRLRDSGLFGGQLVLAGNPGVGYDAIRDLITLRKDGGVVHTGYVSTADRANLLRGARAFAFPSLHEGFGIPILEAFAADTPVLTSNRGAMAEVAGGAALEIDPESVAAIHRGLETLLSDQAEIKRLVAAGKRRAKEFGWRQTAAQIHEVLTDGR